MSGQSCLWYWFPTFKCCVASSSSNFVSFSVDYIYFMVFHISFLLNTSSAQLHLQSNSYSEQAHNKNASEEEQQGTHLTWLLRKAERLLGKTELWMVSRALGPGSLCMSLLWIMLEGLTLVRVMDSCKCLPDSQVTTPSRHTKGVPSVWPVPLIFQALIAKEDSEVRACVLFSLHMICPCVFTMPDWNYCKQRVQSSCCFKQYWDENVRT